MAGVKAPTRGILLATLLTACGAGTPAEKIAGSRGGPEAKGSVGEAAVASGGLSSLSMAEGGGAAEATPGALSADLLDKDSPVKLDGALGEWPARTPASAVLKGSGDRISFGVAIQYDASHLYLGGEVVDESFFRTDRFADGEDHASLLIAFPTGVGTFVGYEVGLFTGKPGETKGEVRYISPGRGRIAGTKIVEAPTTKGYTFEAVIPWSAFPEARTVRVGLRGAARYYDSDGSAAARNILATAASGDAGTPTSLPPLLTQPERSMVEELLEPKGLASTPPRIDILADVAGDPLKERIAVFDRFLTICGPGFRGGRQYFFRDLGAELVRLEARELTGRGKADLIVRRRFPGLEAGAAREWFEVWSLLPADEPTTTFAHEISVQSGGKRVDDSVHAVMRQIEVSAEPAVGWDASTYREPLANDVEPILLPWGPIKSQLFRFDGSRFVKVKELSARSRDP